MAKELEFKVMPNVNALNKTITKMCNAKNPKKGKAKSTSDIFSVRQCFPKDMAKKNET